MIIQLLLLYYSIIEERSVNLTVVIWPQYDQWYQVVLYSLGPFHLFFSLWMAVEFISEKWPYIKWEFPWIQSKM